uniref:Ig-like domain-containing protein n=1 Tax=Oryzias melastigma TaxID=30732 RepID=A0A3B3C5B1_ORYME
APCQLFYLSLLHHSSSEELLTQTPGALSVVQGQTVSIRCKSSRSISYHFNWYLQKQGEVPKFLIYATSNRQSGVSDRFSGSSSGLDYTLTISGVQPEDSGVYYCETGYDINSQSFVSLWWTFGGGTRLEFGSDTSPSLTVLLPSKEEKQQGNATLMCVANKGFPSDWTLSWKVDGCIKSSNWEESRSPGVLQKDGLYSWSSTLRLSADQWEKSVSRFYSCIFQRFG